jgi:hypothetical protein
VTPERWNRIQSLFLAMADVPPAERATRLREVCNGDRRLRQDVERLLEADHLARDGRFIWRLIDDALADGA